MIASSAAAAEANKTVRTRACACARPARHILQHVILHVSHKKTTGEGERVTQPQNTTNKKQLLIIRTYRTYTCMLPVAYSGGKTSHRTRTDQSLQAQGQGRAQPQSTAQNAWATLKSKLCSTRRIASTSKGFPNYSDAKNSLIRFAWRLAGLLF